MSVEAPKPVEETPVVEPTKVVAEQPETTAEPTEAAAPPAETTEAAPVPAEEPAAATEEVKKDEPATEIIPASEGVLGYKEPTFFKKFIFSKHYFWFQEEPTTAESLTNFMRSEKADTKHSDAAWARETGKGLLFYSKRVEDKATPAGIINLSDASNVIKEGLQFSFKAGAHVHRFEASSAKERDSWVAGVEKAIEEAKSLKEEITGSESYKKNVEEYAKPAFVPAAAAVKASRSKSKEPKKSVDASTAAAAATTADAGAPSSDADEVTKPAAERSQSRKRGSIFGTLLSKKEEHAEKKEEKPEVPAKDDTKETPEAAEASLATAAAPVASDKKEEKEEVTPTEKKNKRGSVFGSLFRNRVASPTTEKSEKDATASSDVPPVSETAPKIEEPIENKPIDTAAVTAPVDTVTTPPVEEPAAAGESSAAPKTEKKGGFIGFIKKTEAKLEGKKETKEETKEDKAAEAIAKDPVAAASTEPTEPAAPTEAAAETTPATEERPARDNKRRTSLFFNKKQQDTAEAEDTVAEPKREKSPLPGGKFIGQLVRRASKAIKSEGPKEKTPAEPAAAPTSAPEAPVSETPAVAAEAAETKPAEPVSEPIQSTPEPVAATVPEVKATA
ncbi:uncharacterized protein Z520_09770 [Fonsecaea multimorphosa CBS 102226]|uniref:Meiotic expression up-regulated protein 6 PH domain-containing protein n=1 Tax=Fonsecaea multimorphosa CBS 102226 TaxID=1442371 RepID=A0A0D2JV31_9EURO|nr:uncharacterized protein Z520_09770 [Fonsecaea multimorphosa CBS 102226]KIX94384.1 hypothetical protein Z520_09770 [Fonsecaea multimorphosa CBS 102226]